MENTPQTIDSTATELPTTKTTLPAWKWLCFAADVLLLALAALLVGTNEGPLNPWLLALCCVAVGVGGALALLPFLAADQSRNVRR